MIRSFSGTIPRSHKIMDFFFGSKMFQSGLYLEHIGSRSNSSIPCAFPDVAGFLLTLKEGTLSRKPEETTVQEEDLYQFKSKILCAACRSHITYHEAEISVNGKTQYTFFNPHGLVFDLICYSSAVGCDVKGKPTPEFSWFPGFSWQVAVCGRCQAHMGWLFTHPENSFFALIQRMLISGKAADH